VRLIGARQPRWLRWEWRTAASDDGGDDHDQNTKVKSCGIDVIWSGEIIQERKVVVGQIAAYRSGCYVIFIASVQHPDVTHSQSRREAENDDAAAFFPDKSHITCRHPRCQQVVITVIARVPWAASFTTPVLLAAVVPLSSIVLVPSLIAVPLSWRYL